MTAFKPVPVIIGLPASGKSTLVGMLAAEAGLQVVSTDKTFDKARGDITLPYTSDFLDKFKFRYGTDPIVEIFATQGDFIDQMGVVPFRDFEEGLLVTMLKNGDFDKVAVDMGGSAFLREPTRQALKEAGFVTVFIEVPRERIADNLMKDFIASKESGVEIRGNYRNKGLAAEREGKSPRDAMDAFSEENRKARTPFYEMADIKVSISLEDSLEEMLRKVKEAYATVIGARPQAGAQPFRRPRSGPTAGR